MKKAACIGVVPSRSNGVTRDLFFPAKGESLNDGRAICDTCEVRPQCLIYSDMTGSTDGMWAGRIKSRKKDT